MYYISKFMKNYNMSYNDTLNMNWFTFNELLESLRIVHAEEDLRTLSCADNHLRANSKNKDDIMKRYKELNEIVSKGIKVKNKNYSENWKKLSQMFGGGK